MSSTLWEDVRSSIFNFCGAFAGKLHGEGVATLDIFVFDAYAENLKLPETDLIGPWQLSADLDGPMVTVRGHVGLSTLNDTNLFRLEKVSGRLFEEFLPGSLIPLYDAQSGVVTGNLVVAEGTSMSPVAEAQQRPLKFVSFVLKLDRTLRS